MHVYMYVNICIFTCVHVYICVYMCAHMYTCVPKYIGKDNQAK